MKNIALLLVIAGVAAAASANEWTDLYVKWNTMFLDPFRWNSYYSIPRTLDDASSAGWVEITGINTTWVSIYCMENDPNFCVLFDSNDHICGVQVGIRVSDVADMQSIYNMSKFDVYQVKEMFGEEVWTTTCYTVDPDVINAGGRQEWNNLTGTEGVWIETNDGYITIPKDVTQADPAWTREACIPEMGTHYYYAMNETMACEDFQPWSFLVHNGTLNAVLLQAFGKVTYTKRKWFEWIPSIAIRPTIPTCPDCLPEWAADYTVISLHIYFTSKPWGITCY